MNWNINETLFPSGLMRVGACLVYFARIHHGFDDDFAFFCIH